MIDAVVFVPLALIVLFFTAPVWFRAINELTTRTVGKAVVICPHCGTPGVVDSTQPQVIR